MFSLMLPVLVGFIAIGVEVGFWYMSQRALQSATDAAAIGGLFAARSGGGTSEITATAQREAVRNGFDAASGSFTLNSPPANGSYTSDSNAIEVLLSEPRNLLFASMYLSGDVTINVRSVAALTGGSEACILALDPTASCAVKNSGSTNIYLNGCSVAVNSNDSTALCLSGSSLTTTECVSVVGGYSIGGSATITTACTQPQTNMPPVEDPYASIPDPPAFSPSDCDFTNYTAPVGATLNPGVYCNGLTIQDNTTLNSGIYYIAGGTLKINSGADVSGSGVSIILTKSTDGPVGYADISVNNGGNVNLTAPATGPYAGILIYQDRNASTSPSTNISVNGDTNMILTGAIYIPRNKISFKGGSSMTGDCTQIIANEVIFTSGANSYMNNACDGTGTKPISILGKVRLVE